MERFLNLFDDLIVRYNDNIGVYLLLILLIPTGIYFSIRFRFLNITRLGHSIRIISGKYDKKSDTGDINHFRALTTALSATIGTGNIVGVALAIYFGGPGAIFWMWITGFLGMILKFAECTLSTKFRKVHKDGSVSGGPMYYMEIALKDKLGFFAKVLAVIFAAATILCSLGTGNMAQSHSMTDVLYTNYNFPTWISGLFITSLVLLVIVGGIKRIAEVTSKLVPIMAIAYFVSAILVIVILYDKVPGAFYTIFHDAFTGTAATGGFLGSAFILTITWGVRRGLFSNEAGQGSAAIAHAAAKTKYPAREGLVASVGPLIDTIIICTITALVIILTGAWSTGIKGVGMTVDGFTRGLSNVGLGSIGRHVVAGGLLLFAFSTIISWSYYGTRAAEYLFGEKLIKPYRYLYGLFVFFGSIWGIDLVWHFVDMVITFMTVPNLIALLLLAPVVSKEIKYYFSEMKKLEAV
ncbi:MAG: sodium:alanine symporter family protein [Bacteroidales bacterium]|nr:sodium:alanine symporter family protein [Bacteroidales bacterium]